MKIGIDARFAVNDRRGIGNYSLNLLENIKKIDQNNNYIFYINKKDSLNVLPEAPNIKVKILHANNYLIWEQAKLPIQLRKDRIDIFHSLGNTAPLVLPRKIKLIVTIHDVMFLKSNFKPKDWYQKLGKYYRSWVVNESAKKAQKIITISEFSKSDILEELKLPLSKIQVIYESFNNIYREKKEKEIKSVPYIFVLGASDPRKNSDLIVKVFAKLRKSHDINLIIAGYKNWQKSTTFYLAKKLGIENNVIFLDYATDDEVANFYTNALFFLYPSLYEGFGMPPLEAMACNCPVIASNTTSIPEIVGEAGLLVDPSSEEKIYEACIFLINSPTVREDLIKKGQQRINNFSWFKMTEETIKVYNSF